MGAPYTVGLAGFGAAFGTFAGGSISSRFALENVLIGFKSPGIIDSDPSSSSEKAFKGGNFFSISSGFLEKVLITGLEGGSFVSSFLMGEVSGASLSWSPEEEAGEAQEGISLSQALNRSCEEEIRGTLGSSMKGAGVGFSTFGGLGSLAGGAGSGLLRLLKIDFLVETCGLGAAWSLAGILAGK